MISFGSASKIDVLAMNLVFTLIITLVKDIHRCLSPIRCQRLFLKINTYIDAFQTVFFLLNHTYIFPKLNDVFSSSR